MNALLSNWQEPLRQDLTGRIASIVIPLDGSGMSRAALPVARTLAQLEHATLHVVYLGERLRGPRQTLEDLGLTATDVHGVVLDQLTGAPAEAIVNFTRQQQAPLIVMATHSAGPRSRAALGDIAEAVLSASPPRIVLVSSEHEDKPWQLRRIVMAHDGTPTSDLSTALAADLSRLSGAEVVALHVAARQASHPDLEPGSLPAPRYVDQMQHEWPAWAGEFMERMLTLGATPQAVNFKLLVTGGQPGSEIAQFARDHHADLVVMTWQGRWRPRPGALKVVVRRSGCPVLLIRAPHEPIG